MFAARALFTLFVTVAVVSCLGQDAIVQETEFVEKAEVPAVAGTTAGSSGPHETDNGGMVAGDKTATVHAHPTDLHDEETDPELGCPAGETLCQNGVCAAVCSLAGAATQKDGSHYMFQPKPTELKGPPHVEGTVAEYHEEGDNFERAAQGNQVQEIAKAEAAAGLGFASHKITLEEHEEHMQREQNEVEMDMNRAAERAAEYKSDTQKHEAAVDNVNAAKDKVTAQQKRVREAKLTLKAEKKALREAKEYAAKMIGIEQHDRFIMEAAGHTYTQARAHAIASDDKLQEEERETKLKKEFEEAAVVAVRAKAKQIQASVAEEQQKALQAHKRKFKAPKKAAKSAKPAAKKELKDCTHLPKVYSDAGGSCSDCPKWAKKGECKAKEYKKFMAHYCQKSCA